MVAQVQEILTKAKNDIELITGAKVVSLRLNTKPTNERVEKLKQAICKVFQVSWIGLIENGRSQAFVKPRQAFYYFALEVFGMGCMEAGKILKQDHTTALYHRNKFKGFLDIEDPEMIEKYNLIKSLL